MTKLRVFHPCTLVVIAFMLLTVCGSRAGEVEPAAGLVSDRFVEGRGLTAFTWDERGLVWTLSEMGNRLMVSALSKSGEIQRLGSFQRRGKERPGLLVHANRVFVSDGNVIRSFEITRGKKALSEQSPWLAPSDLFPKEIQISSLSWSPLGHLSFLYRANDESGVGRLDVRRERWDVAAKGLNGDLAYDLRGFPLVSDEPSRHLFRLQPGLDYAHGLHNYTKNDLALAVDKPGLKAAAIAMHPGAQWPGENRGTWLVTDRTTSTLQQFREEEGRLKHWRNLARWNGSASNIDLQIGPDGAVWLLLAGGGRDMGSIHRLRPADLATGFPPDFAVLATTNVVALLKHPNSWQRETASRVLDDREELRQTRGLHPGTPLHRLYNDTNAPVEARILALLSLHRHELLDETLLENVCDEREPALRAWAALLFGERNYPTGVAFEMLMKLAKQSDIHVRMAAAVAARQFVSGSLAIDTPPRAMPIREVYTGGILSTLWFSTEQSRSPAFDLLFWNAVKPISAFDGAHPMGFFTGDGEERMSIAYWIIGLLAQQIAENDDPLRQEDGMRMMADLKPAKARLMVAALQGLKTGSARRRSVPTEKSLEVLKDFSKSDNGEIAALAREILALWQKPLPSPRQHRRPAA